MILPERCPRCKSQVMRERDSPHSHFRVVCMSGHSLRYEALDADGRVIDVTHVGASGLLSTREWATNMLSPEIADRIESLEEGAYGAWDEPATTKWCSRCAETLPLDQFYKHSGRPDGLQGWCKRCCDLAEHNRRQRRTAERLEE